MGLVGKLLSFVRAVRNEAHVSDTKLDPGGGPNVTAEHFAGPGDDAYPMPGDYVLVVRTPQAGRQAAAGYVDPLNAPAAGLGEKRSYARGADGVAVVELWLKNDGAATLSNSNGRMHLQPNGDVVINGVTIYADGRVDVPASLVLNGRELNDHTHGGVESGGSSTGPNVSG